MKIAHICNRFDPSCVCVRDVRELNKYSRHAHRLFVKESFPSWANYQFEPAERIGDLALCQEMLDWCDAIVYEYAGHELGIDSPNKPAAFRNICVYGPGSLSVFNNGDGKFACPPYPNPLTPRLFDRYRLTSSCCVGGEDFLPQPFRWVPCLHPLDGIYTPDYSDRQPCVSYIKHKKIFSQAAFPRHLNAGGDDRGMPHAEVLRRRRAEATLVIDNVQDGHYGLAGTEALSMGLPVVTWNHEKTKKHLLELTDGGPSPFIEVGESFEEAIVAANEYCRPSLADRMRIRAMAEQYFDPKRLVEKYWDPFVDELVS